MDRNARTLAALELAHDIGTVILIVPSRALRQRFEWKVNDTRPTSSSVDAYLRSQWPGTGRAARTALWEHQFDFTVNRLLAAGKTVVLVYPVPEIGYNVPASLSRMLATGAIPQVSICLSLTSRRAKTAFFPFLIGLERRRGSCGSSRISGSAMTIAVWSTRTARRFTRTAII